METATETIVAAQYGRSKGAPWFEAAYKKDVLILGQGGISSWLSVLCARTGATLHTYDHDKFEAHNLNGAFASKSSIGMQKTSAIQNLIMDFSPDTIVHPYAEKFGKNSLAGEIMMCGFDNMAARKLAFNKWLEVVEESEDPAKCFFQDGRLSATIMQIYNICGNDKLSIERYQDPEVLFDDSEVDEGDCTFRQTSHTAAMIAGHMVGFYTNWLQNTFTQSPALLPFNWEYNLPFNHVRCIV